MEKEEKIAEFIGAMLGDGCIGIYNCKSKDRISKQYQLKITLDSRNKSYISYVSNLIKEVLDTDPKVNLKKHENTADIRVFRREKVLWALNKLGLEISPKWGKMKIPLAYEKGKISLYVLRGLFDTDGSVTIFNNNGTIYPRLEIRICPSPAKNQIIEILKEHNFDFKIQELNKGQIKVRISGTKGVRKWFKEVGCSNFCHIERAKQFLE
jgi:hypothetical protein